MNKTKIRYFQYLRGEHQGDVVTLITTNTDDPEMIRYVFSNGEMCNVSLVAELNDEEAFNHGMWMCEVADPGNVWTFEDNSLKDDVRSAEARGKDGESLGMVEGVDPYMHGKDGLEDKRNMSQIGIPPKHIATQQEIEEAARKMMGYGISSDDPKFIQGVKSVIKEKHRVNINEAALTPTINNDYNHISEDGRDVVVTGNVEREALAVTAPTVDDMKRFHMNHDCDVYVPDNIFGTKKQTTPPVQPEIQSVQKQPVEQPVAAPAPQPAPQAVPVKQFNASPIYGIVKGCKKKAVKAPLVLDLMLPGKSVYEMIKENFDDSCTDDFFDMLIDDISDKQIRTALRDALKASYEGSTEQQQ